MAALHLVCGGVASGLALTEGAGFLELARGGGGVVKTEERRDLRERGKGLLVQAGSWGDGVRVFRAMSRVRT